MLAENKQKIVKIISENKIAGTGFLVTANGIVLTCFHTIKNQPNITVELSNSSDKLDVTILFTDIENDIAVLKIVNENIQFDYFSFASSLKSEQSKVETFGFPNIEPSIGLTSIGAVIDCDTRENGLRRIQTRFKEVEHGFSGAPLLKDGYVIGMIRRIIKPNNTLRNIETSFAIPSELIAASLPDIVQINFENVIQNEIKAHNSTELERLKGIGIYDPNVYYPRAITQEIESFVVSEDFIFLIAGQSGIGKTNTVLNFVENCPAKIKPLYFDCSNYYELGFKEIICSELKHFSFNVNLPTSDFLLKFEAELSSPLTIIFDGLETLNSINKEYFKRFLRQLKKYATQSEKRFIKIILTINKDYLLESFPNFSPITNYSFTPYNYELFYINGEKPFFEIGRFAFKKGRTELAEVYELYRKVGHINQYGKAIGVQPLTVFEQINKKIKRLIAHPFTLKSFLVLHHEKEIPNDVTGIDIYEKLIERYLYEKIPNNSKETTSKLNQLLANFADEIYFSGNEILNIETIGTKHSNSQIDLVHNILLKTPILKEISEDFNPLGNTAIRFRTDWYYEYFLFLAIYKKLIQTEDETAQKEIIKTYLKTNNSQYINAVRAITIIAELILLKKTKFSKKLVFHFINEETKSSKYQLFTNLLFESLRMNYNFKNMNTKDLLSNEYLNEEGALKVLKYIDELEHHGHYEDALELLNVSSFWDTFKDAPTLKNRYLLSLAFNEFHSHDIDKAMSYVKMIDKKHLGKDISKYHFIFGRCYQFNNDYESAIAIYSSSSDEESEYGFRCAHQLAFITMMNNSNYKLAGELLEDIINKMSNVIPYEQQLVSKLLYATCLYRTDEYGEGENILQGIIKLRRRARNHHKEGTALRALSELYFFQFEREKALDSINEAIRVLEGTNHYMSLAYALDIKAQITAVLLGDIEAALQLSDDAIALCYKAEKNKAAISWSLQTKSMIYGLSGNTKEMNSLMNQSEEINKHSPFQELLKSYITILSYSILDKTYRVSNQNQIAILVKRFKKKGIGWFPMILEFLLKKEEEIAVFIDDEINKEELINSFIYEKIFHS